MSAEGNRPAARARAFWAIILALAAAGAPAAPPQSRNGLLIAVHPDLNRIDDPADALGMFYDKLAEVAATKTGQTVILHIGDSHVDGGYLTGVVRAGLQAKFGDAGRGLVKPTIVGVVPRKRIPTLEIRQDVRAMRIGVGLKADDPAQGFNSLLVFHEKGNEYYDYDILDANNRVLAKVISARPAFLPGAQGVFASPVELPGMCRSVVLRTSKTIERPGQRFAQFFGISLENHRSGVMYHSYGVIGGTCDRFLASVFLSKFLERVQPDLVIVSLGTNDASTPFFKPPEFAAKLDALVTKIRASSPAAGILLATAPDSHYPRSRGRTGPPNPHMASVREVIVETANQRRCAVWDLFAVMGGEGSMKVWRDSALANTDTIHFTKDGYVQQGRLLLEALLKGYGAHAESRPR